MPTNRDDATVIHHDRLSDGTRCFVAEDPVLPGCVAYGTTPAEASTQLADVRSEYLRLRGGRSSIG